MAGYRIGEHLDLQATGVGGFRVQDPIEIAGFEPVEIDQRHLPEAESGELLGHDRPGARNPDDGGREPPEFLRHLACEGHRPRAGAGEASTIAPPEAHIVARDRDKVDRTRRHRRCVEPRPDRAARGHDGRSMQIAARLEQGGNHLAVAVIVNFGEREKPAWMRVDQDDRQPFQFGPIDRVFDKVARPSDRVSLPSPAGRVRDEDGVADDEAQPRTRRARAQQNRRRLETVAWKEMLAHPLVAGAVQGQRRFRPHSPTSFANAASASASCVTTLSVAGFHGAPAPRWRDQPWNSRPFTVPRSWVLSIVRPDDSASGG